MTDRMTIRRAFLREDSSTRLKKLAATLAAVGEGLVDCHAPDEVRDRIDESIWMIEWVVPDEGPDLQVALVELQKELFRWRVALTSTASRARALSAEGARARGWSDRLMQVSALDATG